jgi:hypothetical protein
MGIIGASGLTLLVISLNSVPEILWGALILLPIGIFLSWQFYWTASFSLDTDANGADYGAGRRQRLTWDQLELVRRGSSAIELRGPGGLIVEDLYDLDGWRELADAIRAERPDLSGALPGTRTQPGRGRSPFAGRPSGKAAQPPPRQPKTDSAPVDPPDRPARNSAPLEADDPDADFAERLRSILNDQLSEDEDQPSEKPGTKIAQPPDGSPASIDPEVFLEEQIRRFFESRPHLNEAAETRPERRPPAAGGEAAEEEPAPAGDSLLAAEQPGPGPEPETPQAAPGGTIYRRNWIGLIMPMAFPLLLVGFFALSMRSPLVLLVAIPLLLGPAIALFTQPLGLELEGNQLVIRYLLRVARLPAKEVASVEVRHLRYQRSEDHPVFIRTQDGGRIQLAGLTRPQSAAIARRLQEWQDEHRTL